MNIEDYKYNIEFFFNGESFDLFESILEEYLARDITEYDNDEMMRHLTQMNLVNGLISGTVGGSPSGVEIIINPRMTITLNIEESYVLLAALSGDYFLDTSLMIVRDILYTKLNEDLFNWKMELL